MSKLLLLNNLFGGEPAQFSVITTVSVSKILFGLSDRSLKLKTINFVDNLFLNEHYIYNLRFNFEFFKIYILLE